MTELPESPNTIYTNPVALNAADLLQHYSFELHGYCLEQQLEDWFHRYPEQWVPFAIIEALYQGRYKVVSVEQILSIWQRRGQPLYHFNHEFERLVCSKFPRTFESSLPETPPSPLPTPLPKPNLSYRKMLLELPSVQAASRLERLTEIPSLKPFLAGYASETPVSPQNGTEKNGTDKSLLAEAVKPAFATPLPSTPNAPEFDKEFKEFKQGVVFGLSSGLATHDLRPKFRLEFSRLYQPDWLKLYTGDSSINQFVPNPDCSEFHNKLKAVVPPGNGANFGDA